MTARRLLLTLAAFLVIGGLAVGLSLLTPARKPAEASVELPRITRLTCLPAGDVLAYAPGELTGRAVGSADHLSGTGSGEATSFEDQAGPVVLTADSLAVAGVYSAAPVRSYAPCAPAATTGTILVTDPGNTQLVITNSDANEAVVDLSLLGPDGEITAVGARGIAVAPGVTRNVALSVLAPEGPVGVTYSASQGRVAMAAVNVEGRDARHIGTARSATQHVIGGIPAEAASTQLVVTNPFEDRVDVTVTALGAASEYELAPTADLSVEPMSTVAVDLGEALGGEAAALRVVAEHEIGAAVVVTGATGSPVTLTGSEPAREVAALTLGGVVQVTNPGTEAVTVRTSATAGEADLEPGTTLALPLDDGAGPDPQWPISLTASGPVVAAAVSVDQPGIIVVPMGRIADDPQGQRAAELDPHLR